MNMMILLAELALLLVTLGLNYLVKRVGKGLVCSLLVLEAAVFAVVLHDDLLFLVLSLVLGVLSVVGFLVMCHRFGYRMNYDKKLVTLTSLVAKLKKPQPGDKMVGYTLPYNDYQLKNNGRPIMLTDLASRGGSLISGASGSGKTHGEIQLIHQDVLDGKSVVYFDYKGDKEVAEQIAQIGEHAGHQVYMCNYEVCDFSYDPLDHLDDQGRVEAILNVRKWSVDGADEHYKTSTQLFLQKVIREFHDQAPEQHYTVGFYQFLQTYSYERSMFDAYNTVLKLLELTLTSSLQSMFEGKHSRKFHFGQEEPFVLVFSFTSATKGLANFMASLMFKDLLECGTRSSYSPTLCLYIDEFGTSENPYIIRDILEKGRSCGIATTLALQDINQIALNSSQTYVDAILGTINTFMIYNGATRQTAEKFAGVQLLDVENVIMKLRKPMRQRGKFVEPTALFISKYPAFDRESASEVYRFIPYSVPDDDGQKIRTMRNRIFTSDAAIHEAASSDTANGPRSDRGTDIGQPQWSNGSDGNDGNSDQTASPRSWDPNVLDTPNTSPDGSEGSPGTASYLDLI